MASKLASSQREIATATRSGEIVVVLLWASWRPFSERVPPIFERMAMRPEILFLRFMVEDKPSITSSEVRRMLPHDGWMGLSKRNCARG